MKKRFIALMTAALMVFSMAVPAFADGIDVLDGNVLQGIGTIDLVPIEVLVPTNLDFALDPLKGSGGVSQGGNDVFFMANISEQDVAVHWAIIFAPGEDVTLDDGLDDDEIFNPSVVDLELHMGVIVADGLEFDSDYIDLDDEALTLAAILEELGIISEDTDADLTCPSELFWPDRETALDATLIEMAVQLGVNTDFQGVVFGFGLEGVEDDEFDEGSLAAFKFYAYMNAFAPWYQYQVAVDVGALLSIVPDIGGYYVADASVGHNALGTRTLELELDDVLELVDMVPEPLALSPAAAAITGMEVDDDGAITFTATRTAANNNPRIPIINNTGHGLEVDITGTAVTAVMDGNVLVLTIPSGHTGTATITISDDDDGDYTLVIPVTFIR